MKQQNDSVTKNYGASLAESSTASSPVTMLNVLLGLTIVYIPYQVHYPIALDIKGLNFLNLLFAILVIAIGVRRTRPITPPPLKWYFLFVFCSLMWGFLIGQTYDGSTFEDDLTVLKNNIFNMLFFFLFYYAVHDVKSIRLLFGVILFVTFVVSVHVWRQAFDYGIGRYIEANRAAGPFGRDSTGANLAAAYFVIFVPLFFALALICKSRPFYRIISFACGVFALFGGLFTYSRQAYVNFAALLTILTIRRNILLGSLVVAAILGYEIWVPTSVVQRIQSTEQVDRSGEKKFDDSTERRFVLWEGAKAMIAERPWGVGLNHFKREVGRHLPRALRNYDVHNGYLLVASETGVIGLISLFLLLFGLFGLGRKVGRLDMSEDSKLLGSGYVISLLGVILSNFFGSRIYDAAVIGNFWVFSGLVARYYTLEIERRAARASAQKRGII